MRQEYMAQLIVYASFTSQEYHLPVSTSVRDNCEDVRKQRCATDTYMYSLM